MSVLRSWLCLNGRCRRQFDAWEAHPACTACGCVRVQWVPGGGHVAGTAKAADADLRALADNFGMSDINSARRDERAKPALRSAPPDRSGPPIHIAPGFAAPASALQSGRAQCFPSAAGVNFKTRVGVGNKLAPSRSVPGVHTGTRIEASHRPPR